MPSLSFELRPNYGSRNDSNDDHLQNDICTPIFREALFIIELTKMSTDRKMKTKWYIYTSEYYSVMTQNEIMILAAAWMDREIIIRTEASQREKDKYRRLSCKMESIHSHQ